MISIVDDPDIINPNNWNAWDFTERIQNAKNKELAISYIEEG